MEATMKIASPLFSILGLSVSTIVTVWLLGSVVTWVADTAGAVGEEVLAQLSTPWIGAYAQAPVHVQKATATPSSTMATRGPAR
jgi:hypothetical protein